MSPHDAGEMPIFAQVELRNMHFNAYFAIQISFY